MAIAVGLVVLIAYGNLRGIREAGRVFAVPTYFFIANMVAAHRRRHRARRSSGELHRPLAPPRRGGRRSGTPGSGLLLGAGLFVVLRAFASGGSALTGTEAISNGVSVFRQPEARNARITLVIMSARSSGRSSSACAPGRRRPPRALPRGTPTVVAQIAKYVYGPGALGQRPLRASRPAPCSSWCWRPTPASPASPSWPASPPTTPTCPASSPGGATGWSSPPGSSSSPWCRSSSCVVTRAQVDNLIPLYAIGVFTGFTMAGAGMVKYHLTHREPHWRRRAVINGTAAVLSFIVDVIIAVTKFTEGAWVVVVLLPLGVLVLLRLHRQYVEEDEQLEEGAAMACEAPVLRRHVVVVLVDRLDLATARAIQYARTLIARRAAGRPLRRRPHRGRRARGATGAGSGCPGCPSTSSSAPTAAWPGRALELAAETVGRRRHRAARSCCPGGASPPAGAGCSTTAAPTGSPPAVGQLPHVNATIVPFQLTRGWSPHGGEQAAARRRERAPPAPSTARTGPRRRPAEMDARQLGRRPGGGRARPPSREASGASGSGWPAGSGRSGCPPGTPTPNLECTLVDGTGAILLVFQGRRQIPGIQQGARLVAREWSGPGRAGWPS